MFELTCVSFDSSTFHWTLQSDGQNVMQTAYRVQVSLEMDFSRLFWDSGEVSSDASVGVPYGGDELPRGAAVYWRARAKDNHGNQTDWSRAERMLTGLSAEDWRAARFITPDDPTEAADSKGKLLRKEFSLDFSIESAIVHVTALGVYELSMNGHRVGDALLCPGFTEYNKRVLHQTYDVTPLLRPGENAVGAMLGAGWFKGDLAGWLGRRNVYGTQTALLLRLVIRYQDGREQAIVTDDSWRVSDAPIRFAELYHGEIYDARLEQPGWNQPRFDEAGWKSAQILNREPSTVVPQDGPLVRRRELLPVREVIISPKGETILDFGQNIAGFVRFRAQGEAGQRVRLLHAEVLDRDGNFYTENMRGARNEILYTLDGKGPATFEPHFTFQGFRYAQVAEYPGEIAPENFEAVVIHSDFNQTGWFECSHPMLNQLHQNILWGLKGNFVDIPTDCPQRDERLGWTGDAQVFARAATYIADTQLFFRKWLRDLRLSQFPDGGVPVVVPDVLTGIVKFANDDGETHAITGWGDAAVIVPWTVYLAYGDRSVLLECYDSMKAWVEYIRHRSPNGLLWNNDYQLGDWVALDAKDGSYFGATATDLIATAYYAYVTDLLSKAAGVLSKDQDAREYARLRRDIGDAFADEFFSRTGRLVSPTQTAHILSLAFGLTPDAYKPRTIQGLLNLLKENRGHLTTGFLGTPYFCQVLADNGCIKQAYDLLLQTDYPSWLYQITKGATTIWEHWDGIKPDGSMWSADMNSFNHYAYGAVAEFLYRTVAGIDTSCQKPGYKELIMRPQPGGGLTYARAQVQTPYGKAEAGWTLDAGAFTFTATVPPNTTATLFLPDGTEKSVGSGNWEFSCELAS